MKNIKYIFYIVFVMMIFTASLSVTTFAEDLSLPRMIDEADILTDEEESDLEADIREIMSLYSTDVVILTVNGMDGKSATAYADDYFNYNGYGIGADNDGILFLVSMEDSDWAISTTGFGITAFTDYGQEVMMEDILPYLSNGEYRNAFKDFLVSSSSYLRYAHDGEPYDIQPLSKGIIFLIAVVIGLVIATIVTLIERSSMISVRKQTEANQYLVLGSFDVTLRQDLFLYSTQSQTKRSEESNGGSTTHTGSSGTTHGGSSGKF